jgi:hypothetical protein
MLVGRSVVLVVCGLYRHHIEKYACDLPTASGLDSF